MNNNNQQNVQQSDKPAKRSFKEFCQNPWNIVGIVLCVVLIPILLFNCILIVKGMVHPDEVPSIGNYTPLIVLTESMDPQIKAGDLILCKKTDKPQELKEGDIISFFDPESKMGDSVVTHQIIAIVHDDKTGEMMFRTKGINNDVEDLASVPLQNVIGVYTGTRFPVVGSVVMFAQSPVGLIVCIGVPVAAFVLYGVLKRRQTESLKDQEIQQLRAQLNGTAAEQATEQPTEPSAESVAAPTAESTPDEPQS